jgi:hypothetical protein
MYTSQGYGLKDRGISVRFPTEALISLPYSVQPQHLDTPRHLLNGYRWCIWAMKLTNHSHPATTSSMGEAPAPAFVRKASCLPVTFTCLPRVYQLPLPAFLVFTCYLYLPSSCLPVTFTCLPRVYLLLLPTFLVFTCYLYLPSSCLPVSFTCLPRVYLLPLPAFLDTNIIFVVGRISEFYGYLRTLNPP